MRILLIEDDAMIGEVVFSQRVVGASGWIMQKTLAILAASSDESVAILTQSGQELIFVPVRICCPCPFQIRRA